MSSSINLARVRYQCRRGMLELDYLLEDFFTRKFPQLSLAEQQSFVDLLESSDQDLFNWLVKKQYVEDEKKQTIIEKILSVSGKVGWC